MAKGDAGHLRAISRAGHAVGWPYAQTQPSFTHLACPSLVGITAIAVAIAIVREPTV
jgi:hypothetical protein